MTQTALQLLVTWIEERKSGGLYNTPFQILLDKITELQKQHPIPELELTRLKTGWDKDKLAIIEYQDNIFQLKKDLYSASKTIDRMKADQNKSQEVDKKWDETIARVFPQKKGNTHIKDCVKCKGKNLIKIVLHSFDPDISKCPGCGHHAKGIEEFFPNNEPIKTT